MLNSRCLFLLWLNILQFETAWAALCNLSLKTFVYQGFIGGYIILGTKKVPKPFQNKKLDVALE